MSVSEPGHLLSQISEKSIADTEEHLSTGGGPAKSPQTGSFSLYAADGRTRSLVTDCIVNILPFHRQLNNTSLLLT